MADRTRQAQPPGGAVKQSGAAPTGLKTPARAPQAAVKSAARSLLYGVNVSWSDGPGIQDWDRDGGRRARQLLRLLQLVGATHTRVPVRWADIERVRGRYDWSALDRLTARLRSQGVAITGVVRGAPDWAIDSTPATRRMFAASGMAAYHGEQPPAAASYADWIRFASALGDHYKSTIPRWEVGYEPDGKGMPIVERNASGAPTGIRTGGDAAVYTRLLKLFSQAIKRMDPACTVAVGALSVPRTDFLQAVYGYGGRPAFDTVALCPAGGPAGLDFAWVDACRQVMVVRGDAVKDVSLAAWGWDSYPEAIDGLQEGHQAKLLRAALAAMRVRPFIQQADWKSLTDEPAGPADLDSRPGGGLCTSALQSKLAFAAFQRTAVPGLAAVRQPPRAILIAGAQQDADAAAAHVDLDLSSSAGASPTAWLGAYAAEPFPVEWDGIGRTLKSNAANWLRLNVFRSGWIRRAKESGWAVNYPGLDRQLHALAAANINVIIQVSPVPGMSSGERTAIVRSLAQRYGIGDSYTVYRWEWAGQDDGSLPEYEPFAQALGAVVPERPVSFASTGGNPIRDAEAIARLCTQRRCPLSSFSWTIQGTPIEASRVIRGIRDALSRYPAVKGTMLAPSLTETATGLADFSHVQRLLDYCPLEQPHGLLGILCSLPDCISREGEPTPNGRLLGLLNRLRGVRLRAYSDATPLRCIAAKSADATRLLIWREDGASTPLPWILRLRGLSDAVGVRIEESSLTGEPPERASASSARGGGSASDTPDSTADIRVQSGEAEALLRLEPGAISLVTIRLRRQPQLELTLSTPRAQWFTGELLDVDCDVHNTGRSAQNVDVELLGGPKAATGPLRTGLGVVPPGVTRRVRFRAHVMGGHAGLAMINVRATGDTRSSLAIRILSPVSASVSAPRYDVDSTGAARVRMVIRNSSRAAILLKAGVAGSSNAAAQELKLPPDGKQVEAIIPVMAPSMDPGCYPVNIAVDGANGRLATVSVLIGVPLECRYASLKPTIDGDLSDWAASDPIGMGRADQVHDKTWRGPTDLSAYAYLRWDEQFLYLACAVTDDVHFAPFSAAEMLNGDSVQFTISMDRARARLAPGYGPGDHEFGIALLEGSHPVLFRFAGPPEAGAGLLKRGAVAARRVGTQTFYEAAVPWSELGAAREREGFVFGFSIRVNDNDGQGRGYIAWGDGMDSEKHPLLFPPVKLVR